MDNETSRFVVVRADRGGERPSRYLRSVAVVGRHGLRGLAFGPAETAHCFERRAEAEDIARRLRRRVSQAEYEFRAEEAPSKPSPHLAAFHWQ